MAITGLTSAAYGARPTAPLPGTLFGTGKHDIVSRQALDAGVAQVSKVTIDTATSSTAEVITLSYSAVNSSAYGGTFKIYGPDGTVVLSKAVSITSDGSATAAEINAALIAAVNADADVNDYVLAADAGSDTATLTAVLPSYTFDFVPSASRTVATQTTAGVISKYEITVNGVTVYYVADFSSSDAEIEAGLVAACLASTAFSDLMTAAAGSGSSVDLTGVDAGVAYTVSASATCTVTLTTTPIATGDLAFGRVCVFGATTARLPQSSADDDTPLTLGVVARSEAVATEDRSVPTGYPAGTAANVVREGYVYVECEEAVAIGDTLYFRIEAGAADTLGAIRGDSDSGTCLALPTSRFALEKAGDASNPAVLKVIP